MGIPGERKWEGEDKRMLTLFKEQPGTLWGWSGVKGRVVRSGWGGKESTMGRILCRSLEVKRSRKMEQSLGVEGGVQ